MITNINDAISLAQEYHRTGKLEQAELIYREILNAQPENVFILNSLGNILLGKEQLDEALKYYQMAIERNPNFAGSYNDLGNILRKQEKYDEAIVCYERAIKLAPDFAGSYYNLGQALEDKGQLDEAIKYYLKAVELNPNLAGAYYNLGNAFKQQGNLKDAIESYVASLRINPRSAMTLNNLGTLFQDMGQLSEAADCLRNACTIDPTIFNYHSNFLLLLHYDSRYSAETIFSEHLNFANKFEEPLRMIRKCHLNSLKTDRLLRIGYVSPDFRRHSVAFFVEPVLAEHNRDKVEVFCYSDVSLEDNTTERMRGYADHWQNITGKSDEQVSDLIRNDAIDILVDLAGHTAHNRMLLFARKPAPVQVSWIGYPATTGLSAMDYKIVDSYTDPPGMTEQFYTEKLIRMPGAFLCYLPDKESPDVEPLPALSSGHITFGSFNNFPKVTPEVIALWARILEAVPGSRLVIKAKSLADKSTREYTMEMFSQKGINAERLSLLPWEPSIKAHLEIYNRIDIALDTFPYNGTTTTCEALWMGVPVITLAGKSHVSRIGVSLLSNMGHSELVAQTPEEYITIAYNLANNIQDLRSVRERLRNIVSDSTLTEAKSFILNLENLFRTIWDNWCKSKRS